jgi:hypothetical protein
MKRQGWVAFVVGAGGLLAGAACTGRTAQTTSASAATPEATASTIQAGSTLVDCGPGQRVLLQQANGVTQVQCVPAATAASTLAYGGSSDFLQPTAVQANVPVPVVYDAPVLQARTAVQARPAYYEPRPEPRPAVRRVATRGRTWKKSAAIIGSSTAAGAGVGALMGGGDGAKKGAVAGLLGGVVYDIATRNK